jgi:hypothetical protein
VNKIINKIGKNIYIVDNASTSQENMLFNQIGLFCERCENLLIDIDDEVVCDSCLIRLKRKNGDK